MLPVRPDTRRIGTGPITRRAGSGYQTFSFRSFLIANDGSFGDRIREPGIEKTAQKSGQRKTRNTNQKSDTLKYCRNSKRLNRQPYLQQPQALPVCQSARIAPAK